jgi:hypothetical protein
VQRRWLLCHILIWQVCCLSIHFNTVISRSRECFWQIAGMKSWLASQSPTPFPCCFVHHSKFSLVLSFTKRGWLLSCFMNWDTPLVI